MTDSRVYKSPLLGEQYDDMRHSCGLRILVYPKEMETAYAMLGVGYGAADTPLKMPAGLPKGDMTPLGVAHFLEHKMFEGKDGASCDHRFAALGAEVNAYTSYDRTVYYISCTKNFKEALAELINLVSELHVTRASVSREQDIISEEIRMNDDSPFERCYAEMLRAMYHHHRVREEICGTEASVKKITPKLLKAHFDAFYCPENMVLAVSGRMTSQDVWDVVNAVWDQKCPAGSLPETSVLPEPAIAHKSYTEMKMQVAKPLFCIGVKDVDIPQNPNALFRRDLCMTILSEMLFSRSGDFYNDLFEVGSITPTYAYGTAIGRGYGYFAVSGEGDDPTLIYRKFCDYVASVKEKGLSEEDFERSRRILYADYITGFDATEDIAQSLITYAMDGVELFDFIPTVKSITLQEITQLMKTCFDPSRFVLSVVSPLDSEYVKE